MNVAALEIGLKSDGFRVVQESPQILGTLLVDGKVACPLALVTTNFGSLKPTLENLRPRLGVSRLSYQ